MIAMQFINSFMFSNNFIFVKAIVDPKPILGTLGTRWEYRPQTHIHTQGNFSIANLCFWKDTYTVSGRTSKKKLHKDSNPSSG